jgi:hypothetical protein
MTDVISNREVDVVVLNISHLVAQATHVEDHGTRTNETVLDHEDRQEEVAEVIRRELASETTNFRVAITPALLMRKSTRGVICSILFTAARTDLCDSKSRGTILTWTLGLPSLMAATTGEILDSSRPARMSSLGLALARAIAT